MIDFVKEAEAIKDELINLRRDLHMYPELGFEESRTSKIIKNFLWYEGIEYYSMAKTGVCGIIRGEQGEGKCIGIRADIDALPILDKKDCYYKSKIEGKMHACGHDVHTTILLGVARIINKYKNEFKGTIKLIFEPAEETVGGAQDLIKEGLLENPHIDKVIGLHVSEEVECGKISIKEGMVNAASNPFTLKITGIGGHGAHPSVAVDPIVAAAYIITSLQTIVSREISPLNPSVITVGSINGGTASNVIPEEVEIKGIIRTLTINDRELACRRVREIVESVGKALRVNVDLNIDEGYPCLYNNEEMIMELKDVAKDIIGEENILNKEKPSMGVESFAYYANERPSLFYYLGTGNRDKGTTMPAHGSYFDVDEDSIPIGVAIQCKYIYEYLTRL